MKFINALKVLHKASFDVDGGGSYLKATLAGFRYGISIYRNGGGSENVATIKTFPVGVPDDPQTDYFPGTYWPSLRQAIEAVLLRPIEEPATA